MAIWLSTIPLQTSKRKNPIWSSRSTRPAVASKWVKHGSLIFPSSATGDIHVCKQIMKVKELIAVVPGPQKAQAIQPVSMGKSVPWRRRPFYALMPKLPYILTKPLQLC